MTHRVQLHHALAWDCPACGTRNHLRLDVLFLSEAEVREAMDLQAWESVPKDMAGTWYETPEEVMCGACSRTYGARDPAEAES